MTEVLAIIPARGGSKGIPRKNLQLVGGKPLLAWSVLQARACTRISRVVVSTDDNEISETARQYGAEVVRRPPEIAGDAATSESALLHVLDHLRELDGYTPDIVAFLQATSPMRRRGDLENALSVLEHEKADSLFSACLVQGFVWRTDREGLRSFSYDFRARQRRQDAPVDYMENGSFYLFRPEQIRKSGNRLNGKIALYQMDSLDSFQIDEPEDLSIMETLMQLRPPFGG